MSWFTSSLSQPSSPMQGEDNNKEEQEDALENSNQAFPAGKGVKDDFSELTKSLTRQLWGVASFLAPPPSEKLTTTSRVDSPRSVKVQPSEIESQKIADDEGLGKEDAVRFDTNEPKDGQEISQVATSGMGSPPIGGKGASGAGIDSSTSGSPSAGGQRLTGFRSDFAELRGSMATGFSRIQSVIRVVTQDEFVEEDDVVQSSPDGSDLGHPESPGGQTRRNSGLTSLLTPLLGNMLSLERRPESGRGEGTPLAPVDHDEDEEDRQYWPKDSRPRALASGIDGLSKLASSLLPFARDMVGEFSGREAVVGLTDEVVAFANNIAMHPETWLDFPLPDDEEDAEFEMTEAQQEHADGVEQVASRLAALHFELCPGIISDGRFWRIYFVLLHSRLSKQEMQLLSTPQVLKTRELLLQQLQKREPMARDTGPTTSECEELGITEYSIADIYNKQVIPKDHLECTAQSKVSPSPELASAGNDFLVKEESQMNNVSAAPEIDEPAEASAVKFSALRLEDDETDVDAWLENDVENDGTAGVVNEGALHETAVAGVDATGDEDVSFSDLEDDDNETSQGEGPDKLLQPTEIFEGDKALIGQDGKRHQGDNGEPEDQSSLEEPTPDEPLGSKIERGEFNDWLTVDGEDAASAGSNSP